MLLSSLNKYTELAGKLESITKSVEGFYPELFLIGAMIVFLFLGLFTKKVVTEQGYRITILILLATLCFQAYQLKAGASVLTYHYFLDMIQSNNTIVFLKMLMTTGSIVLVQYVGLGKELDKSDEHINLEYFLLVMSLLLGASLMVMSSNFLMLFIAIEFVSLVSYCLVMFTSDMKNAREAAIKYFVFGAIVASIMAYGMSWVYVESHSLNYGDVQDLFIHYDLLPKTFWMGLIMFVSGILFKLSLAPFHFWTPDVYEGSSFKIASLFAYVPKVAGIGVLIVFLQRLRFEGIESVSGFIAIIAILSMIIGNFGALKQTNIKRLLGYSTIAQSGFLIVGLIPLSTLGTQAILFYALVYLFISFSAFVLADWLCKLSGDTTLESLSGLGKEHPFLAVAITVSMLGLIGLPPTVGFSGKYMILASLASTEGFVSNSLYITTFVIAIFTSVVSLFYYIKVPFYLFVREGLTKKEIKISTQHKIFIVLITAPVVMGFIGWSQLLEVINLFIA